MSKGDELAARAAKVTARGRSTTGAASKVKRDDVRITVDLKPLLYRTLTRWCADAADELGKARIPAAEVIRALIVELDESDELAAVVLRRLRESGTQ